VGEKSRPCEVTDTVGVGFGCISRSMSAVLVLYPFLLSSLLVLFCGMSSDSPTLTLGCSARDPYHQQHHFESVRSIGSRRRGAGRCRTRFLSRPPYLPLPPRPCRHWGAHTRKTAKRQTGAKSDTWHLDKICEAHFLLPTPSSLANRECERETGSSARARVGKRKKGRLKR